MVLGTLHGAGGINLEPTRGTVNPTHIPRTSHVHRAQSAQFRTGQLRTGECICAENPPNDIESTRVVLHEVGVVRGVRWTTVLLKRDNARGQAMALDQCTVRSHTVQHARFVCPVDLPRTQICVGRGVLQEQMYRAGSAVA